MTTELERRKAQMAAAAARRTEPNARPAGVTLDLSPELHRQLTRWAHSAAVELDVPRVALADMVRAMIRVTMESPDDVMEQLRRDREQ